MKTRPLSRSFYERDTLLVARALLGKTLIRQAGDVVVSGKIVETEAYRGHDDPASHAFRGRTARNSIMFDHGGLAYVYFIYGRNWCLNVTTESIGTPAAVLIRAIEPLSGLSFMIQQRGPKDRRMLTNGPGKLANALDITGTLNGVDLTRVGPLYILDSVMDAPGQIVSGPRIGVNVGRHLPWRFYLQANPFVSKTG